MAIDEGARQRLYTHLQELLDEEDTATLMGYLPPTGWADVATKRDLDQLARGLRAELEVHEARIGARLETGLGTLEARLETELGRLEARLEARQATLEARLDSGLATLKAHVDTGVAAQVAGMEAGLARASLDTRSGLRTLFLGLVGLQMSGAALAVAVARAA